MRQTTSDLYVLLVGNVIDGIQIYGPFGGAELAGEYAEQYHKHDEWIISKLIAPEED